MQKGAVAQLFDRVDLALDAVTCGDTPVRWSDNVSLVPVRLFVADLGETVVTSCFIPVKVDSSELFLDQTYENVRQFHAIRPIIDDVAGQFRLEGDITRHHTGTTVLIGGSPENNWYHWVLNWFPRLALTEFLHANLIEDLSVKFAFHSNAISEPYRSFIDMFGLQADRLLFLDPNEGHSFQRLLVPTFGNPNSYYPALLRLTRDALFRLGDLDDAAASRTRRIFVSRETITSPKRRVANRDEFYAALARASIEPVILEGMAGIDQIRTFASSDLVVGVHGAGLANLLFAPPSTKVLILDNRRNMHVGMTGMFSGLCKAMDLEYSVVPVDEEVLDGVDYENFYNLHNRDVIVELSTLDQMMASIGNGDAAAASGSAITRRQLDDYVRATDELLVSIDPFIGFAPIGYEVDYLGIQTALPLMAHWYPPTMMEEGLRGPRHRTTTRPTPLAGEPYFESGSVLRAVSEGAEVVTIMELGGGYGARSCEFAFHCKRVGKRSRSIVLEPVEQYLNWGIEHFQHNGLDMHDNAFIQSSVGEASKPVPMRTAYQGFGNEVIRPETVDGRSETVLLSALMDGIPLHLRDGSTIEMVNALPLASLLAPFDVVDLVDIDVQHLEHVILRSAWEVTNRKVKRLHVGTHSVALQDAVRSDLIANGWLIEVDLPPYSETACLNGPTKINDGILAAYNPRLRRAAGS